jgi:hypothetical protein
LFEKIGEEAEVGARRHAIRRSQINAEINFSHQRACRSQRAGGTELLGSCSDAMKS